MLFISLIKESYCYKYIAARIHRISVRNNPKKEMCRVYHKVFHQIPNIENPRNLIEKIYWLQLYSDTTLWSKCADKYAMRDYVKGCGCDSFLPTNYGKWDNVDDICFDDLPNQFVLKLNNGCGTVMLVKDKSKIDEGEIKKKLKRWMRIPTGWSGAELHYTRIEPCIIAEDLLHQDEQQRAFSPESMVDYKVWCINGEPENILVVYGRTSSGYSLDLYDTDWNRMDDKLKLNGHFKFNNNRVPKPSCLKEMFEIAKSLAKPFPEVRVDFYVVNDKPVIGELTFTTGYGYFTDEYYNYLGGKIDIEKLK